MTRPPRTARTTLLALAALTLLCSACQRRSPHPLFGDSEMWYVANAEEDIEETARDVNTERAKGRNAHLVIATSDPGTSSTIGPFTFPQSLSDNLKLSYFIIQNPRVSGTLTITPVPQDDDQALPDTWLKPMVVHIDESEPHTAGDILVPPLNFPTKEIRIHWSAQ